DREVPQLAVQPERREREPSVPLRREQEQVRTRGVVRADAPRRRRHRFRREVSRQLDEEYDQAPSLADDRQPAHLLRAGEGEGAAGVRRDGRLPGFEAQRPDERSQPAAGARAGERALDGRGRVPHVGKKQRPVGQSHGGKGRPRAPCPLAAGAAISRVRRGAPPVGPMEEWRPMLTDIQIAQAAKLRPIVDVAAELGLGEDEIETYGRYKAKIHLDAIERRAGEPGKLVLVTGINPTPAGEGKSTTAVGLADGLRLRNRKVVLCLREPSLGPVFGIKGGATGGGYAQVLPMEDINLHFTGDFH